MDYNSNMKKIFLHMILILLALSMIVPFLLMFLISLSGNENIFTEYKSINLSFAAYRNVFASIPLVKYFLNSLIVAFITTLGQVIVSAFAGFDNIMNAYNTAVKEKYRFFSFGDAMFIHWLFILRGNYG